ncbi:CoA pyrophosphatase [Amphritea sp. 1_MG-2023]|uniref:CoA pyrophosphatase n=1 Tax=Amphritea sp. 1_MG-2023 TaxID=3062670 RepID=UPI0026E46FA5|nr:CoA pyrophosphatase [Amphritea sp. 1_MG-2023]MDO6563238.1 CoA pyrophosphatase [Amphritea sp. 1_MG-2023]
MIDQLKQKITRHTPKTLKGNARQASVLIALTDNGDDPEVILTRRCDHLSTHSGEIAFPGGKRDATDPDLLFTALREAQEEVGLQPGHVDIMGQLGDVLSKHQLQVRPYVGVIPADTELIPNLDELDRIHRVPLSFFLDDRRHHTDKIRFRGMTHYVPAYEYEGDIIWGLTAYMLVELLNVAFDAQIPMKVRPEHRIA